MSKYLGIANALRLVEKLVLVSCPQRNFKESSFEAKFTGPLASQLQIIVYRNSLSGIKLMFTL